MRHAVLALLLTAAPALADNAWVQAVDGGYEARIVTEAPSCPPLHTASGDAPMQQRAAPSDKFPRICSARLAAGLHGATINGLPLPLPVAVPRRILVLGDTGCRIKGAELQACNNADAWPFPRLAAAAAKLKPDLIIHAGDYLYRESACPQGNEGCAGSPWGDNWTTWQADFYTPAAPLLAAAPIVLVRGNHEDCSRAGPGWTRLQGPTAFDASAPCLRHQPLFTVDAGGVTLAVSDDATAEETSIVSQDVPFLAADLTALKQLAAPVWLVHHRPIWAAMSGPLGIPVGGSLTWSEAVLRSAPPGGPLLAPSVKLMLGGHIHTFEAINYTKGVPPQLVAGNGGDNLMRAPLNLRGSQFLGHTGVTVADGLSVEGFGFLLMTRGRAGWDIQLYDSNGAATRHCRFHDARLDCPA